MIGLWGARFMDYSTSDFVCMLNQERSENGGERISRRFGRDLSVLRKSRKWRVARSVGSKGFLFLHSTIRKTLGVSMGGSQLKQLNAAISSAGLSRSSQPNTNSKKRKRGGAILEHREKRVAKLNEIHEQFNQFDVKVPKLRVGWYLEPG